MMNSFVQIERRTSPCKILRFVSVKRTHYLVISACCGALAELVLNDTNAQQIAQTNGIYTIGLLILPSCSDCGSRERKAAQLLQVGGKLVNTSVLCLKLT
jgi:hypothetical protein